MGSDSWKLFPDQMNRLLEEHAKQAAEMHRLLAPSIQAAQDTLKKFGGLGLHESTLAALKMPAPPAIDWSHLAQPSAQLAQAVGAMGSAIKAQALAFPDLGATLARALEVPLFLRDLGLPTRDQMRKGLKRFVRAAESLAKAGWTFPMEMTPREVVDLAEEQAGDPRRLDQWFLDYYAADDGREFRDLTTRLVRSQTLANWRPVLRECLCAYKRGLYRVMVPSLLATIEGLVCEITGTLREKHVKVSRHWQTRTLKPPEGAIIEAQWCATTAFLESLWGPHDFDKPAPGKLNRHWVLHGRRPQIGSRADALRLLAAVDFIADASRNIDSLATRPRRRRRKSAV